MLQPVHLHVFNNFEFHSWWRKLKPPKIKQKRCWNGWNEAVQMKQLKQTNKNELVKSYHFCFFKSFKKLLSEALECIKCNVGFDRSTQYVLCPLNPFITSLINTFPHSSKLLIGNIMQDDHGWRLLKSETGILLWFTVEWLNIFTSEA